jgi:hypothetical protein
VSRLSFVLPFYQNPGMLAVQYDVWAGYPQAVKDAIEIVLVDDGSPADACAQAVRRPGGLPALRIYRVLRDLPWHQHGARNLGASEAIGPWLFLTDMDHVLPADSAEALLGVIARAEVNDCFMFRRLDAPDLRPKLDAQGRIHPHVNTFALRKDRYWQIGGYDEDCTGYGTDGFFRQRLHSAVKVIHLPDVSVVRYPREVVPDASTRSGAMDPKAFRDAARRTAQNLRILSDKRASGQKPTTLAFPWERVL